jgi:hypothetical protein
MAEKTDYPDYWRGFEEFLLGSSYQFPQMNARVGEFNDKTIHGPHYVLVAWANSKRDGNDKECRFIRCGIVIHQEAGPGSAKRRFDRLLEHKGEINKAFGSRLDWDRKDDRHETQIQIWEQVDPKDKTVWTRQFQWLAERLEKFYRIFMPYFEKVEADIKD